MYLYIYDEFVQDKRLEKDLLRIENRLTDLGVTGKVARLALFRDAEEMIRDEVSRGVTTVVAVGNDDTIRKVIDAVADFRVTFGLIPLGNPNTLARLLGIPDGVAACDVLSARMVESIDIGMINGRRFITGLRVPNFRAVVTCEGKYRMQPVKEGELEVRNLAGEVKGRFVRANPRDGLLETVLTVGLRSWNPFRKHTGRSVFPLKSLAIKSEFPISVLADGEAMTGTKFDISISPHALKIITGKARAF